MSINQKQTNIIHHIKHTRHQLSESKNYVEVEVESHVEVERHVEKNKRKKTDIIIDEDEEEKR